MKKAFLALATVIYASFLVVGLYHTAVLNIPWAGYTLRSNLIEYALAPLWVASIIALWRPKGSIGISLLYIAPFTAFVHGMAICLGGDSLGGLLILGAFGAGIGSFRGHLYDRTPGVIRDTAEKRRVGPVAPRSAA